MLVHEQIALLHQQIDLLTEHIRTLASRGNQDAPADPKPADTEPSRIRAHAEQAASRYAVA
ncbi:MULTISPECIES: hypothetical protein [Spirosoma]|uniref:Uncharacterized protein n=1 Tax=Spirosoma sordidisoli TaxID=2502893 RepID=A0A4Q2UGK4_9BACT|nr:MULTISPECIES: hypothetical protein [Spirosoma]RYC68467.1 hypothetical protein EQG79_19095 [Spirosoma sordidisoli]